MIELLDQLDKTIFLFLNSFHSPFWDSVMWFVTGKKSWIPFYVVIIAYIFWEFGWKGLFTLGGIGLTILLADQFASGLCKPLFERFRPSHSPELTGLVHLLKDGNGNFYKGGSFGFISSHAANTFGLAMFLFLHTKEFSGLKLLKKYVWVLFIWATIVSYSRIYVGVHYTADIILGALAGIVFAKISYRISKFLIMYSIMFQKVNSNKKRFDF